MSYLPHAAKSGHGTLAGVLSEPRLIYNPNAPVGAKHTIYGDVTVLGLPSTSAAGHVLRNIRYYGNLTLRFQNPSTSRIETHAAGHGMYDTLIGVFTASPFGLPLETVREEIISQIDQTQVVVQKLGGRWSVA